MKSNLLMPWLAMLGVPLFLCCSPDLLLGRGGDANQADAGPSFGGSSPDAAGGAPGTGGESGTGGANGSSGINGAGGDAGGSTGGDAGNGGTSPNPQCTGGAAGGSTTEPSACDRDFQALNKSCSSHADCALVFRYACVQDASSQALGIQTREIPSFEALTERCGTPTKAADCPGDHGCPDCWHAPVKTDLDEPFQETSYAAPWAACISGHCQSLRSVCGPLLCGNSALDHCTIPALTDPIAEPCDGADLGGKTCRSLNYGSGALSCQPHACQLHETGCNACFPTSGRLVDCQSKFAAGAYDFAFAANDAELVVAWLATANDGISSLQLARFGPDLTRLSPEQGPCFHTSTGSTLSIARFDRGWVVAVSQVEVGAAAVELHAFGDDARYLGLVQRVNDASYPLLAGRPVGPPLLSYLGGSDRLATILSADLTAMTPPVSIGTSAEVAPASAIFTGDAFLVAGTILNSWVRVIRVGLDGAASASYPVGMNAGFPHDPYLAQTGGGSVLLYANNVNGHNDLVRLGASGAPVSAPISVLQNDYSAGPAIGVGADLVVPIGATPGGRWFSGGVNLVRMTTTGQVVWRIPIAAYPRSVAKYQVVQRGPELVVGWITGEMTHEALGLARVLP